MTERKLKGVRGRGPTSVGELIEEGRQNGESSTTATAARTRVDKRVDKAVKKSLAGRQKELPGMETKRDKKMDEYVATYVAIAAEHTATWNKLGEVKGEILAYMKKHDITAYPLDDEFDLSLEATEFKLKKKRRGTPDDKIDAKDVPKKARRAAK